MEIKLSWKSYLLIEKYLGCLLSGSKVKAQNTYSYIHKVTGQVWENQNKLASTLIKAITSLHLPKSISTDHMTQIQF